MFKNQTRTRKIYSALGGQIGVITIVLLLVVAIIFVIYYIHKRAEEYKRDQDDFLRYKKLIRELLMIKRNYVNYDETQLKFDMDRFQFSSVLIPVGSPELNQTWDTDSEVFGKLCSILLSMVSIASDTSSKYYKNTTLWKQILYAIRTIAGKLPDKPQDLTPPWGINWYQYSITYPTLLVSTAFLYLDTFGQEDPFLTRHLSSYIKNYYKESTGTDGLYSMGWLRTESNVIGMSVPLIGGRLYANQFDRNANSQIYARDYLQANYVYQGNGFYYDNTYITHVSRNDGYTTSFYYEFKFIYNFYRMQSKVFDILHKNFSITEHPDIPLHHGPWFNRGSSMKGFAPGRKFATYGIDIRGYERSVCVRTKTISLHYCGQIVPVAAYESDRQNKEWGQCWIFMRRPLTKTSAEHLYVELVPYYDGVHSYGLTQINWPSVRTTTTTWQPESALCSLAYFQDKAAGMYNKFKILMADEYSFDVEEINLVTPNGFHVYYQIKPNLDMAVSKPYTIACRLGKKDSNVTLTGIGTAKYAFDDFIGTFIYLDDTDERNVENVVKITSVKDPATGENLDALYVQPTNRNVIQIGFSNNFYEYGTKTRVNNLSVDPTINQLVTDDFKLEKLDTEDAILFLHNLREKKSVVTYAFNNVLPQGITIKKSILDDKFSQYTVQDGIFNKVKNEYTVNTYEKQFQIVLNNVILK